MTRIIRQGGNGVKVLENPEGKEEMTGKSNDKARNKCSKRNRVDFNWIGHNAENDNGFFKKK